MAKYGLGKGLGALIPESSEETLQAKDGDGVRMVETGLVEPSPDQPRKRFDDQSIAELAASLQRHGVIQPLIVEQTPSGRYRIVAGERRWRAAGVAGLAEIPVIVREFGREKRLEVALVENVQREDLNPVDEAEAYRQLMEVTRLTQDQVAERVGKSRPAVANALRLLNLPSDAMEAVRAGDVSAGHARAILSATNPADRSVILKRIVDDGISVREAEALAAELNQGAKVVSKKTPPKKDPKPLDPDVAAIEQDLIGALGTKVTIRGDAQRGSITIDYFSMDDLDRLYGIITGKQ
ncbi:MAG: ParB/RepB/Spo0J family partition protein [Spirochaetia bacterium]|nr:ParB/RepB/Spo0J family partition protein [Spirochaetia bacterium]